MAQTKILPCREARIEEEEFYHIALSQSVDFDEKEESLDDFFGDGETSEIKPKEYPSKWRGAFYDPFERTKKERNV